MWSWGSRLWRQGTWSLLRGPTAFCCPLRRSHGWLTPWEALAGFKAICGTGGAGRHLRSLAARRASDVYIPAKCLGPLLLPGVGGRSLAGLGGPAGERYPLVALEWVGGLNRVLCSKPLNPSCSVPGSLVSSDTSWAPVKGSSAGWSPVPVVHSALMQRCWAQSRRGKALMLGEVQPP